MVPRVPIVSYTSRHGLAGRTVLSGLAADSERCGDDRPPDPRLPGVPDCIVQGCLGALLVARCCRDGVDQRDPCSLNTLLSLTIL